MKPWQRFFRSFEPLERLIPQRTRLPLRYRAQKLLAALEPEMALLPQLCASGEVAVDIGANRGVYTYALAQFVAQVHSFDPLRECCDYIGDYGSSCIAVHNIALSDVEDTLKLYIPQEGWRTMYTRASLQPVPGRHELRKVPVMRLDDFGLGPLGFIKIDVEGHELAVLRGAREHLLRDTPNLLVEIDHERHAGDEFLAVFNFLYGLGYESYIYQGNALVAARGRETALADTCINFIFQHAGKPAANSL